MTPETIERLLADILGRVVYIVESLEHGDIGEAKYVAGDLEQDLVAHIAALRAGRST